MKCTRLVSTDEGESRFMEFEIPLFGREILGHAIRASNGLVSPNVSLVEAPEGTEVGWHGATTRRILIVLSGVLEVELGSGEKRQWHAGELLIADDTEGRHVTRVVEGPCRGVFIPFSPDFVVDTWEEKS